MMLNDGMGNVGRIQTQTKLTHKHIPQAGAHNHPDWRHNIFIHVRLNVRTAPDQPPELHCITIPHPPLSQAPLPLPMLPLHPPPNPPPSCNGIGNTGQIPAFGLHPATFPAHTNR
ncbi:Hypothetical predicted protein, partial [Pelobates cultripes]